MNKSIEVLIGQPKDGRAADAQKLFEDYREYAEIEHLYNAAIRQLTIKFEILNDEFKVKYERSPIHHIESRVKTAASIVNKLLSRGADVTPASARENINDIAEIQVTADGLDETFTLVGEGTEIQVTPKSTTIPEKPTTQIFTNFHIRVQSITVLIYAVCC